MKTIVDDRLRREAKLVSFVFSCDRCVHYDDAGGTCANGYPNQGHRQAELEQLEVLEFCKEFELA